MDIYINNTLLPKYTDLTQSVNPNAVEHTALDSTLFVDVINTRRSWTLKFDLLSLADYTTIKTIYDAQFSGANLYYMQIPALSIYVKVYLKLNERQLKYTNKYVSGLELTVLEVYGVS